MHPADLQPGDQYRVMFVLTPGEQVHDALSNDINVYNTFINGVGNAADSLTKELNTTWKVAGSTATVSARMNTGVDPSMTGFPIYRPDGVRLSNDYMSFWGGLLAAPNVTERGLVANPVPVSWAYTGSRPDGTPFPSRELGGPITAVRTGTFGLAELHGTPPIRCGPVLRRVRASDRFRRDPRANQPGPRHGRGLWSSRSQAS